MRDEQSNAVVSSHDATLARRNDEIFELTDDCLLEELEASRAAASQRKAAGLGEAVDTAAAIEETVASLASNAPEIGDAEDAGPASVESAKFDIPPLPSEEEIAEINSVLTNVVAEMHRITDVKGFEPPADLMPGMPEPRSASAASSSSHATKPQAPARPSAPATPARKPAWSARNRSAVEKPKQTSASEKDAAKSAEATAISEAADTASEAADAASKKPSPLMEAIATTLVTALADTNERQENEADNARAADAETRAPGANPVVADAQEPLPEEVVAPDVDEAALENSAAKQASPDDAHDVSASDAPKDEASGTSQAAGIETPELPGEDASDAVTRSGVSMASETPQEGDTPPTPSASEKKISAVPEATSVLMGGSQAAELPAGLEGGVQEMLKPMLAAWLNENLPRLVEKALSDELAKRDLPKTE